MEFPRREQHHTSRFTKTRQKITNNMFLNRGNDLHIQPSQLKVNMKMCCDGPIFYLAQWSPVWCVQRLDLGCFSGSRVVMLLFSEFQEH